MTQGTLGRIGRLTGLARRIVGRLTGARRGPRVGDYEAIYEAHAQAHDGADAVGVGDFDLYGRIERDLLVAEGLGPNLTLVDFGCGSGRLAVHALSAVTGGCYVGIDISHTLLARAERLIRSRFRQPPCRVVWQKQTTPDFALPDESVDMVCAFSVFTHLEHEDTYRYLRSARRIVRPGGKFIFSCLPIDHAVAREVFLAEAAFASDVRWQRVRNVTTSVDYISEVARLAGWTVDRWYRGDEANIGPAGGPLYALGQSSCVLVK